MRITQIDEFPRKTIVSKRQATNSDFFVWNFLLKNFREIIPTQWTVLFNLTLPIKIAPKRESCKTKVKKYLMTIFLRLRNSRLHNTLQHKDFKEKIRYCLHNFRILFSRAFSSRSNLDELIFCFDETIRSAHNRKKILFFSFVLSILFHL